MREEHMNRMNHISLSFNPTSPAENDHPNRFYLFDLLVSTPFPARFEGLRKREPKKR